MAIMFTTNIIIWSNNILSLGNKQSNYFVTRSTILILTKNSYGKFLIKIVSVITATYYWIFLH